MVFVAGICRWIGVISRRADLKVHSRTGFGAIMLSDASSDADSVRIERIESRGRSGCFPLAMVLSEVVGMATVGAGWYLRFGEVDTHCNGIPAR